MLRKTIVIDGEVYPRLRPVKRQRPAFGACDIAIVRHCPFCGRGHQHGWGSGTRISHCAVGDGVYYLDCGPEQDDQDHSGR